MSTTIQSLLKVMYVVYKLMRFAPLFFLYIRAFIDYSCFVQHLSQWEILEAPQESD